MYTENQLKKWILEVYTSTCTLKTAKIVDLDVFSSQMYTENQQKSRILEVLAVRCTQKFSGFLTISCAGKISDLCPEASDVDGGLVLGSSSESDTV